MQQVPDEHSDSEPVLVLSSDEHRKSAGGQVALSERLMKITRVHPCPRVGEVTRSGLDVQIFVAGSEPVVDES